MAHVARRRGTLISIVGTLICGPWTAWTWGIGCWLVARGESGAPMVTRNLTAGTDALSCRRPSVWGDARHASQNERLASLKRRTGKPCERWGAARGANGEQTCAPNGPELHSTALNGTAPTCESRISADRRTMASLVHT
jgi:hypothetical protein